MESNQASDGRGRILHEGDRVYVHGYLDKGGIGRFYGTLHRNIEYPQVSDWYIKFDAG